MNSNSSFKCIKIHQEKGMNWMVEWRRYALNEKWWNLLSRKKETFNIKVPGEFYFDDERNSLPKEGNKQNGSGLGPFVGKKYIDWILENANGKIKLYCMRDWGYDALMGLDRDVFKISFDIYDNEDAMAFKLRWL